MKYARVSLLSAALVSCALETDPSTLASTEQALQGGPRVQYVQTSNWGTGFNANVTFTNDVARQCYTLNFKFPINVLPSAALPAEEWTRTTHYGDLTELTISKCESQVLQPGVTRTFTLFGSNTNGYLAPLDCAVDGQRVACNGSDDLTNPSAPTGLVINAVGERWIDLSWNAPSDNVGVTDYVLWLQPVYLGAMAVGQLTGNHARVSDIDCHNTYGVPSGCYFYVEARDAAGNRARSSGIVGFTNGQRWSTLFSITHDWGTTYEAEIAVTNTGAEKIDPWAVGIISATPIVSVTGGILSTDQLDPTRYFIRSPDYDGAVQPGTTKRILYYTGYDATPEPPQFLTFGPATPQWTTPAGTTRVTVTP